MSTRPCVIEKGSKRDFRKFIVSMTESPFNLAAGFDAFFKKGQVNKIQYNTCSLQRIRFSCQ